MIKEDKKRKMLILWVVGRQCLVSWFVLCVPAYLLLPSNFPFKPTPTSQEMLQLTCTSILNSKLGFKVAGVDLCDLYQTFKKTVLSNVK